MRRSRIRRVARLIVAASLYGCGFDSSGLDGSDTDVASDPTTGDTSATAMTSSMTSASTDPSDPSDPTTQPTTNPTTDDPTTGASAESETSDGSSPDTSTTGDTNDVEGWWDVDWAKRRPLTLKLPSDVGAQENVPLLVILDSTRITYDELQTRGQDLRFVDEDDETLLAHEIEHWDSEGTSAVWVLVPEFDPSDLIYMYWGNPDAPAGNDPHAVWASGYAGTYHLDNDPTVKAPQILDSSPSDRHATALGDMMADDLVPGIATPALTFDGVDDVARIGSIGTDAWTELTVSAWVRHTTNEDDRAVSKAFGTGASDHVFFLGAHGDDVKVRVRTDGELGGTVEVRPVGSLPVDTWAYVAMVWSAASQEVVVYVDGVEVGSGPLDGDTLGDGASDVLIGNAVAGQDRYWDGPLDEVRIEHVAREPEWLLVQRDSMNDDVATFEPEEMVP